MDSLALLEIIAQRFIKELSDTLIVLKDLTSRKTVCNTQKLHLLLIYRSKNPSHPFIVKSFSSIFRFLKLFQSYQSSLVKLTLKLFEKVTETMFFNKKKTYGYYEATDLDGVRRIVIVTMLHLSPEWSLVSQSFKNEAKLTNE